MIIVPDMKTTVYSMLIEALAKMEVFCDAEEIEEIAASLEVADRHEHLDKMQVLAGAIRLWKESAI